MSDEASSAVTFLIITPLVVSLWRGGWELLDDYLYPGDKAASAWASLALGSLFLVALKLVEPSVQQGLEGTSGRSYGLGERLFTLSLLVSGLGIWHGLWHLYDVYMDQLGPAGDWASFAIGVVGLLALRNLRSAMPVPSAPVRGEARPAGSSSLRCAAPALCGRCAGPRPVCPAVGA